MATTKEWRYISLMDRRHRLGPGLTPSIAQTNIEASNIKTESKEVSLAIIRKQL